MEKVDLILAEVFQGAFDPTSDIVGSLFIFNQAFGCKIVW